MVTRLRLFIVPESPNSVAAENNLRRAISAADEALALEIVDVLKKPEVALSEGILVTPTLIVSSGNRSGRMVGSLEPESEVLQFLSRFSLKPGD